MSKALILVGGGKGGVRKSLFSMAVVDASSRARRRAAVSGSGNGHLSSGRLQDVPWEAIEGELVNLDEREGGG